MKLLRWLRCHVLSLHRAADDFYETCYDCGYWESDKLPWKVSLPDGREIEFRSRKAQQRFLRRYYDCL